MEKLTDEEVLERLNDVWSVKRKMLETQVSYWASMREEKQEWIRAVKNALKRVSQTRKELADAREALTSATKETLSEKLASLDHFVQDIQRLEKEAVARRKDELTRFEQHLAYAKE